ncbi:MAG: hypothetical protein ABI251_13165, partial [Mycobacteriaceae bacterium]
MSGPTSPRARCLRAAAVAGVVVTLAAAGHDLGGGGLPDPAVLLTGSAAVGVAVTGLARTRLNTRTLLGVLLGAQVGLHLLFGLTLHPAAAAGQAPPVLTMLTFHVLAALLSAVVLANADRAVFALATPVRLARMLLAAGSIPVAVGSDRVLVGAA